MDQNNLGLIIKDLRIKKNLSQDKLCDGICSKSQLFRIEKGKHLPSILIVQQLSIKLGEDINKYLLFSNCSNPIYFSLFFTNLETLRLKRCYSKILLAISELETSNEYTIDINLPSIKQLILWYKGTASSNINETLTSIDYYIDILKLTVSFSDLNEIFDKILTTNEIRIIHSIAATYCRLNKFSTAKNILTSLINNIKSYTDINELSLMPEIFYNLSKLLLIEKEYTDSLTYASQGIDFCINNNFSSILADLFYVKGKCYEELNDIENALINFNKFICLYDILGHDKFSIQCKNKLISSYYDKIITFI